MEIEREDVRVEWVELGEGFDGDFDEDDPDDLELLRFDVSVRVGGEWREPDDASWCTGMPVRAPEVMKRAALEHIMDEVFESMRDHGRAKGICHRLSWISPDDEVVIRTAVMRTAPEDFRPLLKEVLAIHPSHGVGYATAMVRILAPSAARLLTEEDARAMLSPEGARYHESAVRALMGTRPDLLRKEDLAVVLSSEDSEVRAAAVAALHRMGERAPAAVRGLSR